jgi:riboflavin-specific deaminase-like protein
MAIKTLPLQAPTPASLPFVSINMAMTADGKIASENRRITSFGGDYDQRHLLELRSEADAVMAGARTLEADEITLGPGPLLYRRRRLQRGLAEYNLRIVVSGSGSISSQAAIFQKRLSPVLVLTTKAASPSRLEQLEPVAAEILVCGSRSIDFRAALAYLKSAWKVQRLLCEGGGELNGALFAAGLVDELHLTICPFIFGGQTAPTLAGGPGVAHLQDAQNLVPKSRKRVRDRVFLVYEVNKRAATSDPS